MRSDVAAWTVASVVADVLEEAEHSLVPQNGYSRLHLAVIVAQETRAYLSVTPDARGQTRVRLVTALEFLREAESNACSIDACYPAEQYPERQRQLDPDSIVGRGFGIANHIAQAALAGCDPSIAHCLNEARDLYALKERQPA